MEAGVGIEPASTALQCVDCIRIINDINNLYMTELV
jgi:hypothetical protein